MYKQLTKLTLSRLPVGALSMTFVIYITCFLSGKLQKLHTVSKVEEIPNKNHI